MIDADAKKFIASLQDSKVEEEPTGILSPRINAIKRLHLLVSMLGLGWLEFQVPETIWMSIERLTGAKLVEPGTHQAIKDQIMALKTAITTDSPWTEFNVFEKCVHAFNMNPVNFAMTQPPSPAEVAWGVKILQQVQPDQEFTNEVQKYIAVVFREYGYLVMPEHMKFSQDELDDMNREVQTIETLTDIRIPTDSYKETVSGIQKARLAAIAEYIKEQEALS